MNFFKAKHTAIAILIFSLFATLQQASAQDLYVGSNSSGQTLSFSTGTNAYGNTFVGYYSGDSSNLLTVGNSGTLLSNSMNLNVGEQGWGNTLAISNGGKVAAGNVNIGNQIGSINNSVIIEGSTSSLSTTNLSIGVSGSGSLSMTDGNIQDSMVFIATQKNSSGSASISGGLWANSGNFLLGYSGSGAFQISGNAIITDVGADVGFRGVGSATVSGGLWSNSSSFFVGNSANGTLTINGGIITDTEGFIGNSATANAFVSSGLWSNSSNVTIGAYLGGQGTLTISGTGTVTSTKLILGNNYGTSATINIGSLGGSDHSGSLLVPTIVMQPQGTDTINFNQTNSYELTSSVSGYGTVNQLGAGTTIFSGSNSYSGITIISAGVLQVGNGGGGSLGNSSVVDNASLVIKQSNALTISGAISGNGTINQLGLGTTTLTASNSFNGPTYVSAGALLIASTGTLSGGGGVTVFKGAKLQNNGFIAGNTIVNGTLSGNGGSFSNLVLNQASSLIWNINSFTGTAGTNWDVLNALSLDLSSLSSTNKVTIYIEGSSGIGNANKIYSFNFLNASNGIIGFDMSRFTLDTSLFSINPNLAGGVWNIGTNSFNGIADLTLTYTAVPEPSTYAFFILGIGAVLIILRRRRS